ncbi:MAG: LysM peptidoglycan-binding domain-containing protein [Anaerolineales bacterium]|nr:LysM peptidoglycan-binding domain-containing protein [Anaerolineales bacterium]
MNDELLRQLPPEDQSVSDLLQSGAGSIQVNPLFQSSLEASLKQAHPENKQPEQSSQFKIIPAIGWAILVIGAVLILNWAVRSLAPNYQPAAGETGVPTISPVQPPVPNPESEATPVPPGDGYERHGTTLYLSAALPEEPAEANVYQLEPEQPATLESARALAGQLRLNGQLYETPGELPGTTNFLIVDGNQRLYVRSDRYFTYYPDYAKSNNLDVTLEHPNAETLIDAFLSEHGFSFDYSIAASELYGDYYALPLTPDGFSLYNEHFKFSGLLFKFNQEGILSVNASLVDYSPLGTFGIYTAEEAFQKLLDPDASIGIMESGHSVSAPIQTWYRPRPQNQTITVYGWMNAVKSLEGSAPLVTLDDYTATGNLGGVGESMENTFVEATGQFQTVDGWEVFNIESWQVYNGYEEGLQGTIQREGDQATITTPDDLRLVLPDVPADLPLPMENAFVIGITRGDTFDWKSLDNRAGQGGGGGGGGTGFYQLNLTGTPVPFPTPLPASLEASEYVVQNGDTLSKIAYDHGITVEELMQANDLAEATIFIGQALIIPGAQAEQSPVGQQIEGQRGIIMVNIYRKPDGSQRTEYSFISPQANQFSYLLLEGASLEELEKYHNRPVDIWGTIENVDSAGAITVRVDRYEIPYPDLNFQVVQGTQGMINVQGQSAITITTTEGKTYVQFTSYGEPDSHGIVGNLGDQVLLEVLAIPDETFGGYPVLRIFSASMAVSPKNGQPQEMQITSDQPYVMDEPPNPTDYEIPTATIEEVELAYYFKDPRYVVSDTNTEPTYIQPVWRFSGHYSNGDEFEIIVQALKEEFLLPEIEAIEPPG